MAELLPGPVETTPMPYVGPVGVAIPGPPGPGSGVSPEVVAEAVAAYLLAHPPTVTVADATTLAKGVVQLAGDLGGTAEAPTVPGLTGKAASVHTHAPADVTGTAVVTNDPRLTDARTPLAHTQSSSTITDFTEAVQTSRRVHPLAPLIDQSFPLHSRRR